MFVPAPALNRLSTTFVLPIHRLTEPFVVALAPALMTEQTERDGSSSRSSKGDGKRIDSQFAFIKSERVLSRRHKQRNILASAFNPPERAERFTDSAIET